MKNDKGLPQSKDRRRRTNAYHIAQAVALSLLLVAVFAVFPCPDSSAAGPNLLAHLRGNAKLHAPDDILADFESGAPETSVIILLQPAAAAKDLAARSRAAGKAPHEFDRPGAPAYYNLHDESIRTQLKATVTETHGRVINQLGKDGFTVTQRFAYQFGFAARVTPAALERIANLPDVITVEKDHILQAHLAQGIPLMNATTVRSSYAGAGVSIAICDTGIDTSHPRLGGGGFPNTKVIGGYDTGDNDADPRPNSTSGNAHGTACAGIAAGNTGTVGDYIGGVAPDAKLYAVKISTGDTGSATTSAMIAGWEWAVTHKYDDPANPIMIISTSFGGGRYTSTCDSASSSMTTAAANAVAAGITIFASSGNDGYCDSMSWPACITYVNSVGAVYDANFGIYYPCVSSASCAAKTAGGCTTGYYATDSTSPDKVTSYSNSASFLTLFAPSNRAYTADIVGTGGYSTGDYYTGFGGTSTACPYAAGSAAVLQQAAKDRTGSYLTPSQVRTYLVNNGDNVTDGKVAITRPRIDLGSAVNAIPVSQPIDEAVDNTSLSWTTGGDANWYGQNGMTHDGVDAAQSGLITHNRSTWVQTTVVGPGVLTFWWKVSSEVNSDYLRFLIDDVEQTGSISGEAGWQQKMHTIAAGSHTVKWSYTKDVSVNSGSDAGWIDQVVFDQTYTVTATASGNGSGTITSSVGGINYSYPTTNTGTTAAINYGTAVTLTATAGTGATVSWTNCAAQGGTPGGTATAATCAFSSLTGTKSVAAELNTTPPDTSPDLFVFTDQSDIALNSLVTSNSITVSGINTTAPVSITGGEYSMNGGAYTSSSGTVNNGDTVTVRVTSSGSYSTTVNATLTIGGVSDTFSVTTIGDTTPPDTTLTATPAVVTNITLAAFTFSGSDGTGSGIASFECRLDSGTYATCTSPQSYTGLTPGSHTFEVRAIDLAGNADPTPETYTWIIDSIPPATNAIASGYTFGNWTDAGSVHVTLSADDSGGSGVATGYPKYCVDITNACMPNTIGSSLSMTCASGSTCTQYVRYQSADNAGNIEAVKNAIVKQDLQKPTDGTLYGTSAFTSISLNWTSASDNGGSGVASYKLVYQDGATAPASCTSGTTLYTGSILSYNHTGRISGTTYAYRVCALDAVGYTSPGAIVTATALTTTYTISASAPGGHGAISCDPTTVNAGGSSVCTITPEAGWHLSGLTDNGVLVAGFRRGTTTYTFTNITEDHPNIIATFAEGEYAINLPRTGQTTSFANGDDGDIQAGLAWPDPRFTVNTGARDNGESITDNLTGLVWTKTNSTPTVGSCTGGLMNWQGALDYVACLNAIHYLGRNDWRLPNIIELMSLVFADAEQTNMALWLTAQGFTSPEFPFTYWSSSTDPSDSGRAFVANIRQDGYNVSDPVKDSGSSYDVWPVRTGSYGTVQLPKTGQAISYAPGDDGATKIGASWPNPRFADNGNGTVTDDLSGLVWLKNANCYGEKTWSDALNAANSLSNGQCGLSDGSQSGDWRLPNVRELSSLIDFSQFNPVLPSGHPFTNMQAGWYWSSTTSALDPRHAWMVYTPMISVASTGQKDYQDYPSYVWPVRGGTVSPVPDTTPPTGTVSINAGAESTTSTSVTLTLSCSDSETGCSEISVSNDNATWTTYAYASTRAWTLTSGNGTKSVYVKFKDGAGNWSGAISDTITLNVTPIASKSPTAGSNNTTLGTVVWSNPGNIVAADSAFATVVLSPSQISNYLVASGMNFAIPPQSIINGIQVSVTRKEGTSLYGGIKDRSIKIVKNGAITGTEHSAGAIWSTTPTTATFGSSTDLWGTTWTPADINAATFGAAIAVTEISSRGANETAYIDHITITVYYDLAH